MRTIPQIRARLHQLADEHGLPELDALAEETRRRPRCRNAPPRRRNLDADLKAELRTYAERHPEAAFHDIANRFNTTIGRVSEALIGKREHVGRTREAS